jgi:hypothetical protein
MKKPKPKTAAGHFEPLEFEKRLNDAEQSRRELQIEHAQELAERDREALEQLIVAIVDKRLAALTEDTLHYRNPDEGPIIKPTVSMPQGLYDRVKAECPGQRFSHVAVAALRMFLEMRKKGEAG